MIQTIAVLGAGTMGHGIAHTFSRHGYQVNLYEPFDAVRESAPQKIREELQFMVDEGYITEADRDNGIRNITMYGQPGGHRPGRGLRHRGLPGEDGAQTEAVLPAGRRVQAHRRLCHQYLQPEA